MSPETDRLSKSVTLKALSKLWALSTPTSKGARREHREALAKLIAQEDQKLMLASKGSFFVAEPLTDPAVSLAPTSPRSSLILAISIVLGGFFGAAVVLIRKALKS